jgi:hypothetical protein
MDRTEALQELRNRDRIQEAFDRMIDGLVSMLVGSGMTSEDALEAIFGISEHLAEEGDLPAFPEPGDPSEQTRTWLRMAIDMNLPEFVMGVVTHASDDVVRDEVGSGIG